MERAQSLLATHIPGVIFRPTYFYQMHTISPDALRFNYHDPIASVDIQYFRRITTYRGDTDTFETIRITHNNHILLDDTFYFPV